MPTEENGWVKVLVRMPAPYYEWLARRAKAETTDVTKLVRRLIRDEIKRVEPDAWDGIEAALLEPTESGTAAADGG